MELKIVNSLNRYEHFLDAEIYITEQLNSPLASELTSVVNRNQSEQLHKKERKNSNLRQVILRQLQDEKQRKEGSLRRGAFTRQHFSSLSKKQSNIRKQNYLLNPCKSPPKDNSIENGHLQIKQATLSRAQSESSRRTFSNVSQRHRRIQSANDLRSEKVTRASTRPQTSFQKMSQIKVNENTQKYSQLRKQNPLVVYQFKSHLKIKRIDDNPKVLATIITKKNRIMDKRELYDYVSKIMERKMK